MLTSTGNINIHIPVTVTNHATQRSLAASFPRNCKILGKSIVGAIVGGDEVRTANDYFLAEHGVDYWDAGCEEDNFDQTEKEETAARLAELAEAAKMRTTQNLDQMVQALLY
jgi:hypothetical protein